MISKIEEKEFQFKPLGMYLVEAELITQNALDTALTAQKLNGKQLGEILAMHGLVKQQTIEYFMENIVLPERQKILKQLSSSDTSDSKYILRVEPTNPIKTEDAIAALQSSHKLEIYLSANKTLKFLLGVVICLALVSLLANFNLYYLPEFDGRNSFRYTFDLNTEGNIPSLYSTAALLFCSILLVIIAQAQKLARNSNFWSWRGLSIVFAGLSLDEFIGLHEKLIKPVRNTFNTSGLLYYAWVIPGAIFVLIFLLVFARFLATLPAKTRQLFFIAGTIYVAGAIGTELVGGYYADYYTENDMIYNIITTVKEVLEMLGIIVFIYSLLSYMSCYIKRVDIRVDILNIKKKRRSS
ncbi:hypothetical protein [aff. Roholtiella sp. LEGE 12411]|uniref:hypothetical protein n=1 Tax=aff. Roholtiella sp. LEGE 12411 TaxID=1828822 RepID=UPI001882FF34|nr:hypothetical protein [aff. Roholtiella sp. LEGE 12411]MBE9034231.1 hypothetical protein [aff. Roholtiella sp. LEGE 12411]